LSLNTNTHPPLTIGTYIGIVVRDNEGTDRGTPLDFKISREVGSWREEKRLKGLERVALAPYTLDCSVQSIDQNPGKGSEYKGGKGVGGGENRGTWRTRLRHYFQERSRQRNGAVDSFHLLLLIIATLLRQGSSNIGILSVPSAQTLGYVAGLSPRPLRTDLTSDL
jgi:hypothetical protein